MVIKTPIINPLKTEIERNNNLKLLIMAYLKITAKLNKHTTKEVGETMNVGELIEYLSQFNKELPIYIEHWSGSNYSEVSTQLINEVNKDVYED